MEILMTYLTNGNTYDISYKWKYLRHILKMEILTQHILQMRQCPITKHILF